MNEMNILNSNRYTHKCIMYYKKYTYINTNSVSILYIKVLTLFNLKK